jgi:polyisoprenoid-binding protein YceI
MIGAMALLRAGIHTVGPDSGALRVHTYREGMAQKVGHDLIIDVGQWQANLEVAEGGTPKAIALEADPRSLQVREGQHGVKPLTDKDRAEIRSNIDQKVLRGQPIAFSSRTVELADGRLTVRGELTMAGSTRPSSFELDVAGDGRLSGRLSVTQSEWGIKPYRALMGALKVRDTVEVVLSVALPTS